MYEVYYIENGEKKSKRFGNRDEAFGFQSELIVKRRRRDDGSWDIELVGVYRI